MHFLTQARSTIRPVSCDDSSFRTATCPSPTSSPRRSLPRRWPRWADGWTGSFPRSSRSGSSWGRSSVPTTPAAPPSPACSPTAWPRDRVRAPPRPAPTARPASACPSRSSPTWPATRDRPWMPRPNRSGCGSGGAFTFMTDPRSRCPTRRGIRPSTRSPIRRSPASASRWHASRRSSRSPAGRSWTWASAATRARGKANWACCVRCGTCFAPATSCSRIA